MDDTLSFLEHYVRNSVELLNHTMIGDEILIFHYNLESKQQSKDGHHSKSLTKLCPLKEIMATVFWTGRVFLNFCFVERQEMRLSIVQQ